MPPVAEPPSKPALGMVELVALMAVMTSLVALSVDTMLPAMADIARELGVVDVAKTQAIISVLVLGMAFGQLFFGPLSDAVGRRPAILSGLACFIVGSLVSMSAGSLEELLFGRLIQGFGVSGPRIASMALIRDQFVGRAMARVMSFIMMVFILVPMLAPALGQLVLFTFGWRMIFGLFILLGGIAAAWFALRQPETLAIERRHRFSLPGIARSTLVVLKTRTSMWLTVANGFIFGAFLTYLSSAQVTFQGVYGVGTKFPLYFALLAGSIGLASFVNSRLVGRFGPVRISYAALVGFISCFSVLLALALAQDGVPAFWQFMSLGALGFFSVGLLFGNLNAMAMQPLGHVAGLGAALLGSLGNFISVPLSLLVGRFYDETVIPLLVAFVLFGCVTLVAVIMGLSTYVDE